MRTAADLARSYGARSILGGVSITIEEGERARRSPRPGLCALRERWPFVVLGARHDSVLLELPEPIADANAFAQQLFDLCPDLARTGFADVERSRGTCRCARPR